ncbi:FCS-Like Zinc finger 13-like [Medicago truncatula]|uniref:DUF581 family protein n=1 Tax=Medicago truncatula TaxID=3880 RepID=A0A072VQ06_MEDTR|nr:FCS-Like Zinc finger 13-like [Medicago truncatula]KEH43857.1 DUF581 family protein [Medicago truncatula]
MESSKSYTRCFDVGCSSSVKENELRFPHPIRYPSEIFLSICFQCKKSLQGKDIYMYRSMPFCNNECRNQRIRLDEEEIPKLKTKT